MKQSKKTKTKTETKKKKKNYDKYFKDNINNMENI